MKILCLFLILLPISCWCYAVEKEIKIEASGDIHNGDVTISKRSGGSFDFVRQIKTGLLSSAGQASASLASGSSGSSIGGGGGGGGYPKHEEASHANSVEYDPWSLKKSVLNTIFQAVKAITGGVTALKGQLIKGSGYALSAGGSLIAASGDKITDVGKGIVNSAQLVPISGGHSVSPGSGGGGGGGFAGKFASLSSLSSTSSGGSTGGHPTSHGTSGHGETITSYEIPTGHQSYGPPSKTPPHYTSTSSQYLPPGTYTSGLHFSGPASYESSPQISYLPVEGPHSYTTHISDRDAHSASEALKEIIHLIPRHETTKLTTTYLPGPTKQQKQYVHQYAIPNDPPLKSGKVGPIASISHTESITTAFGSPLHNFQKHFYEVPHNSIDNHHHHHPYEAYHAMSLKYGTKRNDPNSFSNNLKTPYHVPQFKYMKPKALEAPINREPKPSQNPSLDIESIVAALEAKSPTGSHPQQQPFHVSLLTPAEGRADRKVSDDDAKDPKELKFEVQKSVGFQISDPDLFNRQLMY